MKISNRWALACLSIAVMAAPVVFAQQQPSSSDPYQGVSQPPPDDTIVATPDTPDTPPPAPPAKPSPAVAAPAPTTAVAPKPATRTATPSDPDSRYDNTDFGIVTQPVSGVATNDQETSDSAEGAVLHTRPGADDGIVGDGAESPNELPEGTEIRVRLAEALSTTDTTVGSPFHGKIMVDVLHNRSVIIPAGSMLKGRVVQVSQGHHIGPAATLRLRPDVVILPDGTAYHLNAMVLASEADGTRTGSEGGIEPASHVVKKSVEYGVGVGTGALVGGELAGPPGLLAGSVVGAGLVTTHIIIQHPEAAVVPAGSEIIFSLTEPLDLTPTRN